MIPPSMGQMLVKQRMAEMQAAGDRSRLARQAKGPRRKLKVTTWHEKGLYGFQAVVVRWPWTLQLQVWNLGIAIWREAK